MTTFALIVADPDQDGFSFDNIVSTHRTAAAAWRALRKLRNQRWAYVAEPLTDGSYPARIAAERLDAHLAGADA